MTNNNFDRKFKAKIVIEALNSKYSVKELAIKYEIKASQISSWKRVLLTTAYRLFDQDKITEEEKITVNELRSELIKLREENTRLRKSLFKDYWAI